MLCISTSKQKLCMLIVGRNHFIAEIFCLLLKLLLNNGPFNNQTGLDHLKLLPSEALLTSNFTMDAEAQALINAPREAQVDLMVRNDVSKLPLWFGSLPKTQSQVANGLHGWNVQLSPPDGTMCHNI